MTWSCGTTDMMPTGVDPPYTFMFPDNTYLCAWNDPDMFRQ